MKKKLVPIVMAVACFVSSNQAFAKASFSDVSGEQYTWCSSQIEEMYKAGLINGYEDGTYRPDNQVTKLECIALFSRAMGCNDETNAGILELAHQQYDSALKGSSLSWGQDELAYMMYKGALTAADLVTYINGDEKNKPMTRGEAAVIITKAMGGENKATSESGVSLHYKDARDIPTNILQYVKYVTDEGIMNGIDDAFCAGGTVTRSQIAVMLSRVTDKCDFTFESGRVNSVDTDASVITYTINGDEAVDYKYTSDTNFYIRGEKASAEHIPSNVAAVIQFSGDTIFAIDVMSDKSDEEISAVFSGYNLSGNTMTIRVKKSANATEVMSYQCASDVPVTYQGSPSSIKALKAGDSIVLSMSDGKVQAIEAVEKTYSISSAKVTDMSYEGEKTYITISSSNDKYDGMSYQVSDKVSITKNNNSAELTDIFVGDKVNLVVEYGQIIKIDASGSNNTIEGVVKAINISEQSTITLDINGKKETYSIPSNCEFVISGKEDGQGSIYDIRVGDNLTLTVQSNAIIKIKSVASVVNTSGRVSGEVVAVNTAYKFISVKTDDNNEPINVFTNTKTQFVVQKGSTNKTGLSSTAVGDTVECYVTPSNGAYIADLIVVSKAG